ncbi:MAG: phenylalanine--tRNA ligase beta subunit-related protein [Planctomycetota bacterium]
METTVRIPEHPLLDPAGFVARAPRPLGELPADPALTGLLALDVEAPFERSEELRAAVRDLLRHGGYKPTGRGKPASEYLVGAVTAARLSPINPAVDACNVASLHSGLPISVVDLDRARAPFSIAIAPPKTEYVFDRSGQTIDVSGLLCLDDADGPCANAVKDSQRTKTADDTQRVLAIVWGTRAYEGRAAAVARWYRELLHAAAFETDDVRFSS